MIRAKIIKLKSTEWKPIDLFNEVDATIQRSILFLDKSFNLLKENL
jgi:hypothetical protein